MHNNIYKNKIFLYYALLKLCIGPKGLTTKHWTILWWCYHFDHSHKYQEVTRSALEITANCHRIQKKKKIILISLRIRNTESSKDTILGNEWKSKWKSL